MNITILNGDIRPVNEELDRFLHSYRIKLSRTGQYVRSFRLHELHIPGLTDGHDLPESEAAMPAGDFRYILNTLDETDLLVLAGTPVVLSVLPAIRLVDEKLQQRNSRKGTSTWQSRNRAEKLPMIGLILNRQGDVNAHDLLLNRLAAERMAANLHAVFSFCTTTEGGPCEAACLTLQCIEYQHHLEKACDDLILGVV